MSIDYNGLREPEITRVPTVQRPAPTRYEGLPAQPIEAGRGEIEKLWELTPTERLGLALDQTALAIKVTTGLLPHLFNITIGLIVKNWKTTTAAIIAALAYLVGTLFGIQLPTDAIQTTALFIIGLFAMEWRIGGSKPKQTTENE
jgi:hypothetical protein